MRAVMQHASLLFLTAWIIICALWGAAIGREKNRSIAGYAILGGTLGLLGIIIMYGTPARHSEPWRA
jgi:hypothetical protein